MPVPQGTDSDDARYPGVPVGDLELLRIETGVLWDRDNRGRIRGPVDLALGVAAEGIFAAVGQEVPDDVAIPVLVLAESGTPTPPSRAEPPAFIRACRDALTASLGGDLALSGGPSYYIEPPIRFATHAGVLRSDSPYADAVLNRRPEVWEPDEWADLVRGGAGALWAMMLHEDRVVSICHTPGSRPGRTRPAAEAGTWTAPDFRGRGYAAATTAAWADLLSSHCPHLFYSTSAENHSSQRVAERLGLRPIGWTWKLTRTDASQSS